MAKEWKPDISESVVADRRSRVLGAPTPPRRPRKSWSLPNFSLDPRDARLALVGGVILGLFIAFIPEIFHRKPPPDVQISREAERRIIAARTLERIGEGGRPIDTDPNLSQAKPEPEPELGFDDLRGTMGDHANDGTQDAVAAARGEPVGM
jgi:hypothetical protein